MAVRETKSSLVTKSVKRNAGIVRILGACIFVCLVFCAGFFLRGNVEFLTALGFSNLVVQGTTVGDSSSNKDVYTSVSARVSEVEDILSNSLDEYELDDATADILSAFVSSKDDSFLRYYDAKSYASYLANASKTNKGIGLLFAEHDGSCFVADVLEGTPAADSGVKAGDVLVAIDGNSRDSWTMPEVLDALGRSDKTVYLTLQDAASTKGETYGVSLPHSDEPVSNITYSMEGHIAVIDMNQIAADSASVMKETVQKCVDEGAKSIVLDLRDVPGGYLTQAVGIASLFMDGTVVQVQTASGVSSKDTDGSTLTKLPLVLLVNKNTAGSAEVLVAALQESGRATAVGVTTRGKGTVQVMQPLSFGGAVRYTAATYLTPAGRSIDGNGVTPEIQLASAPAQTTRALELAAKLAG